MSEELQNEIRRFIDENRTRALWWTRADYYPQSAAEARADLRRIASRGDRDLFVRAMTLARRLAP